MVKTLAQDFKFDEVLTQFAPYLDEKHSDYDPRREGGAMLWLRMRQFPEYLSACLSDPNFWDELEEYRYEKENQNYRASLRIKDMKLYEVFASNNFPERDKTDKLYFPVLNDEMAFPTSSLPKNSSIRKQDVYPLGYDETELSIEFINQNMDYEYAMIAIKMCLLDYFSCIRAVMKEVYDFDPFHRSTLHSYAQESVYKGFSALLRNARAFSFLQDLMPIIANTLRQQENPFTQQQLHKSFADAFRRQSFQSMSLNLNNRGFKKCPFTQSLVEMMCLSLNPDPKSDGQYIAEKTPYVGALIVSMRDHIQEHFVQALPKGHKAYTFNPE